MKIKIKQSKAELQIGQIIEKNNKTLHTNY